MPGGKGNIKPSDNPKPFKKGDKAAEQWTEERALELANELIEWLNEKDENGEDKKNMFFEEFLVIEKDLYPELIKYLCGKFSTFFKLIEKAKKIQEIKLVKYGVKDSLNATMTKFVLTNHHGWTDRKEENTNQNVRISFKE